MKNGVTFPPKAVYRKKVDGEMKTFGCLCKVKNCLRKCCDLESVMYINGTFRNCTSMPDYDIISRRGLNLSFINNFDRSVDLENSNFGLLHGKPCQEIYLEDKDRWFLQEVSWFLLRQYISSYLHINKIHRVLDILDTVLKLYQSEHSSQILSKKRNI